MKPKPEGWKPLTVDEIAAIRDGRMKLPKGHSGEELETRGDPELDRAVYEARFGKLRNPAGR